MSGRERSHDADDFAAGATLRNDGSAAAATEHDREHSNTTNAR